jgi:hypothetical protein
MLKFLFTVVACFALASVANAAITPALDGTPTADGSDFLWTYQISVDSLEELVAAGSTPCSSAASCGSFFTIYDFAGYVPGSITAPAGWSFQVALAGPGLTNSTQSPDEPTFDDLTFVYTGPPVTELGPVNLSGFSAQSTFNTVNLDGTFTYQADNAVGLDAGIGPIEVPVATPEPSMAVPIGLGVIGTVLRRRKRRP